MSQFDYIKEIAKLGLENDTEGLIHALNELVEYAKKTKKTNFAIQLQSILKDAIRDQQTKGLSVVGSTKHLIREEDKEIRDFIIEKLTSDYRFKDLVIPDPLKDELNYFIKEHRNLTILRKLDLPISNKILFHGASGCGKTLASYVLAGELDKMMLVVNLGAIVSSKLGETSKNLAKIFRRAAVEDCIIFIDEFDSLGKVRDDSQDHGEMKRVVNTILQLFDYLPQSSIVIAATNHTGMIDTALLRRFDSKIHFDLPNEDQIKELIDKTLKGDEFKVTKGKAFDSILKLCVGLSYFTIQRTLIDSIKRSIFNSGISSNGVINIDLNTWKDLITKERNSLGLKAKRA